MGKKNIYPCIKSRIAMDNAEYWLLYGINTDINYAHHGFCIVGLLSPVTEKHFKDKYIGSSRDITWAVIDSNLHSELFNIFKSGKYALHVSTNAPDIVMNIAHQIAGDKLMCVNINYRTLKMVKYPTYNTDEYKLSYSYGSLPLTNTQCDVFMPINQLLAGKELPKDYAEYSVPIPEAFQPYVRN